MSCATCSFSPRTLNSRTTWRAKHSNERFGGGGSTTPRRASERAWLCQIARSIALDHFRADSRRRKREERFAQEMTVQAQGPLGGVFSPEIETALASLTAGEREVIGLRIVLDLDAEHVARLLRISRSACSMRLARALQKLEERIGSHVQP